MFRFAEAEAPPLQILTSPTTESTAVISLLNIEILFETYSQHMGKEILTPPEVVSEFLCPCAVNKYRALTEIAYKNIQKSDT